MTTVAERQREVSVPVDSGTIEMSATGNMQAAAGLYSKGQELSCWTADVIWDGKKGGVGTPTGDGPHTVKLRVFKDEEEYRKSAQEEGKAGLKSATLAWNRPDDPKVFRGFTLHVGDCGNIYGTFEIPPHHGLAVVWLDEYTLEIQVLP